MRPIVPPTRFLPAATALRSATLSAITLSAITLSAITLPACDATHRGALMEHQDEVGLGEAVDTYWKAIRWGDISRATSAWTSTDDKNRLATFLSAPPIRITDVSILTVTLDGAEPEGTRRGTALVRVEAYENVSGKVSLDTVTQHWKNAGERWVIDDTLSPLGTVRPWVSPAVVVPAVASPPTEMPSVTP